MTFTPLGESNSYPLQFNEAKFFVGNNQLVKGSPFLKCVVSIWTLPEGGGGCVKACLGSLEHFFPHVCPEVKRLARMVWSTFSTFAV